ncbi:MAG: putative aminohydrolase SsnA [Spirochaetaceae bacterium]|nr:MAG: putative aminohydrolase SsnA [Spirochaetaceae bacterium]
MILIRNATALEFDPPSVRPNLDILIDGGTIAAVGSGAAMAAEERAAIDGAGQGSAGPAAIGKADKVIDAGGRVVFPGIVCSHHHYYSGLARGITAAIGATPDFISILKNLWWRIDRAADEQSLYASGLVCNLDAIRAGTTAVIDHNASPSFIRGSLDTLKRSFEKVGIRGATCYEVTDRHGRRDMLAGVQENVDFARRLDAEKADNSWSGLFECHIGGHAPCTLPDEGLEAIADAVRETGRGLHLHVAEDAFDVSHSHLVYGSDIVPRLERFGLLSPRTILAHGIYLDADEVALLNERDVFLVHNARSNMNNGVGYNSRLPQYRNLALGSDGIGGDMFTELKHAYFKHKDTRGPWWPQDFLKALAAGNRILERNFGGKFGRLEAGYSADIVIADYDPPTPLLPENIAGHFVFGMDASITRSVLVGGKLVYEDREFPFDTGEIYHHAREQARRLWQRMEAIKP